MNRGAILVVVIWFALSVAPCAPLALGNDNPDYSKTVPPEILRLYDPGLIDGSRPKLVTITQEMIWSLRSTPDQGGDVYTLDMVPSEVSTVQKNVLLEWIKAGHNVLIQHDECAVYWELFPGFTKPKEAKNCPGPLPVTLSEHPANTDCANVTFYAETDGRLRRTDGSYGIGHNHLFFLDMPENAVVVASLDRGRGTNDPGGAVAGCIPHGCGGVFFVTKPPQGSDTDRWMLNFRQWMLGLPIPGAADTTVAPALRDPDADAGHRITLNSRVLLGGEAVPPEVTIETGHAELTLGLGQIAALVFEGNRGETEVLTLRLQSGETLVSEVSPSAFSIEISNGRRPSVPNDQPRDVCRN